MTNWVKHLPIPPLRDPPHPHLEVIDHLSEIPTHTDKTLCLVQTLHLLDKSFSNTLCKCNTAFSFACGRFQVVSYPNKSNQRQALSQIYKITLIFNTHNLSHCLTVKRWLNLKHLLFYTLRLSHACFSVDILYNAVNKYHTWDKQHHIRKFWRETHHRL